MMTRQSVIQDLKERFASNVTGMTDASPRRVYLNIRPEALADMAVYLVKECGARFNTATGIDMRDGFELLYHFTLDALDVTISLRTGLRKDKPVIASLTPHFEAADWIEREIFEMLGITFTGHPNPKRLLLPDEWPQGVYPLRADYQEWDKDAIRGRGV
jgi:Ni,Fe-hydrogenase III component G